jgi:hypothetical protein
MTNRTHQKKYGNFKGGAITRLFSNRVRTLQIIRGDVMDEKERLAIIERRKKVFTRLRNTRQGETICLSDWEVKIILDLINRQKQKIKSLINVLRG